MCYMELDQVYFMHSGEWTPFKHIFSSTHMHISIKKQDCFLQKEARVCVSNAFVLEDSMYE